MAGMVMSDKYKFEAMNFKVPAEVAGMEIRRIEQESGGFITPAAVVDAARPEDAPLHPVFTWDDSRAAELYRREEARHLIRSVRVLTEGGDTEMPLRYVNVIVNKESVYTSTFRALGDEEMRQQVIADAIAYLRGAQKRYQHLNELADVTAAMGKALDKAEKKYDTGKRKSA